MKKYFLLAILLILFGCELIVDIDVPFDGPHLTINSVFNPDSLWNVSVSLNRHILNDSTNDKVENAQVVIYKDGAPIETLAHKKNGIYRSVTGKPFPGNGYEIKVSADGYPTATSRSYVPIAATILDVTNEDDIVHVRFKDDPNAVNFYQVMLEIVSESVNPVTGEIRVNRSRVPIESEDPILQNENSNWYNGILLKDILFNGKETEVTFKKPFGDAIYAISLYTLSEDYYKYITTAELQIKTSGDPFAQPVNVSNNINNGFGVFSGLSRSTYTFGGPRPVITSITPSKGRRGDRIIIKGENLTIQRANLNGMSMGTIYPHFVFSSPTTRIPPANYNVISGTEFEVIVPNGAISGKIYVERGGLTGISTIEFEVIE